MRNGRRKNKRKSITTFLLALCLGIGSTIGLTACGDSTAEIYVRGKERGLFKILSKIAVSC